MRAMTLAEAAVARAPWRRPSWTATTTLSPSAPSGVRPSLVQSDHFVNGGRRLLDTWVELERVLNPYVADTAITNNYSNSHAARFYRNILNSVPDLLDVMVDAPEGLRKTIARALRLLSEESRRREKWRAARVVHDMVEGIDRSSVLYALVTLRNHDAEKVRGMIALLVDAHPSSKRRHPQAPRRLPDRLREAPRQVPQGRLRRFSGAPPGGGSTPSSRTETTTRSSPQTVPVDVALVDVRNETSDDETDGFGRRAAPPRAPSTLAGGHPRRRRPPRRPHE